MKHKAAITDIMRNSIHLINESYNRPLHLNVIARQNFMSPATYSRYFFEFTQCNFTDYVNQLRVEHAKRDLIYTSSPLTEIALDNGFSNSSVFSKIFKHYTQISPSDFRQKYKISAKSSKRKNQTVTLEISGKTAQPYNKTWLYALNAGEARLLIRSDFQQQILELKEKLSFEYLRIWDLFSDDIFPCGFTELRRLDFSHLDNIFDFLVSHSIKPWLNLTKRSDVLLSDISHVASTPPNLGIGLPSEQFASFYEMFFRHWTIRYGSDNVSQWVFECWFDDMNFSTEYVNNFIHNFAAIKSLLSRLAPGAKVGAIGSALPAMHSEIDALLQHWPHSAEPDFISVFCFPYERLENNIPAKLRQTNYTQMSLQIMARMLAAYKMEHIPVYIAEWNITVSPRNALNDSCAAACILLSNIEETLDHPWPIIFWHASDTSMIRQDTLPLIFGGTGMLTRNSLCKPTFYALSFFKKMSKYCVSHGPGYIITTDKVGRFDLLLFNACPLPDIYYQKKEYEITTNLILKEFSSGDTLTFSIDIRTEHTAYRQTTTRLSQGDTDLLGHLQRFGEILEPSSDEIEYLRHTIRPELTVRYLSPEKYHMQITQLLNPYDIYYISLCPIEE